ncbi:MAG: AAA family ATPase [Deinococcota bacterium]
MGLVYITGISGVGKSAVCHQLKRRGYAAFGTDEDGISAWYDSNGHLVDTPPRDIWRTHDWQTTHSWRYSRERLEHLAARAADATIFVCGSAANENEVWDLFSQAICLLLDDEDELMRRLSERSSDGFRQEPHELAAVLNWNKTIKSNYIQFGATMIDTHQTLDKVVSDVINAAGLIIHEN